jgi:molecular chaperone GrpE
MTEDKKNNKKNSNEEKNELLKEIEALKKHNENLSKDLCKISEERDAYIKANLELDTFRKKAISQIAEMERLHKIEKEQIQKETKEKIILTFCSILDEFEKANKSKKDDSFVIGVEKIFKNFLKALKKEDVIMITINNHDDFDPKKHEAVVKINSALPENRIVDVIQNGFKMNDKVIRYARVVVSSGEN